MTAVEGKKRKLEKRFIIKNGFYSSFISYKPFRKVKIIKIHLLKFHLLGSKKREP